VTILSNCTNKYYFLNLKSIYKFVVPRKLFYQNTGQIHRNPDHSLKVGIVCNPSACVSVCVCMWMCLWVGEQFQFKCILKAIIFPGKSFSLTINKSNGPVWCQLFFVYSSLAYALRAIYQYRDKTHVIQFVHEYAAECTIHVLDKIIYLKTYL